MTTNESNFTQYVAKLARKHFPEREVAYIKDSSSGLMHKNCIVEFIDGSKVFFRDQNPERVAAGSTDLYFGDPISLTREIAIMNLLRQTEITVPEVFAFEEGDLGKYAFLSFLEGIEFREYLERGGHRIEIFLDSLQKIGRTLATAGRVTFSEYGSIQPNGILGGRANFADRLGDLLARHEHNLKVRTQFTNLEWKELRGHIERLLETLRSQLVAKSQIVIYDLHVRNFYVNSSGDRAGDISGAFDVEFAQAAPANLEWGCFSVQVFPLYGEKWYQSAKDAFLKGFYEGGGVAVDNPVLEQCVLINHALSAAGFYSGMKDGIRDTWGSLFKEWALDIARGSYDPSFIIELTRPLHKVPLID